MSEPYSPEQISGLLKEMEPEKLAKVVAADFQRWPTKRIVPAAVIRELIANEKARRKRNG